MFLGYLDTGSLPCFSQAINSLAIRSIIIDRGNKMINRIREILNENADAEQSKKMFAYMKNRFEFAGIPKPKLKELIKPFIKKTAKEPLNWNLIFELWECDKREAQYVALEYLQKHRKQLVPKDIDNLKTLIVKKSWWETVDTIDAFVGDIVMMDKALKRQGILLRIWYKRIK